MTEAVAALARRLWPSIDTLPERDRGRLLAELAAISYSVPLLLISTVWLVLVTDVALLQQRWPFFLLLLAISVLASKLFYFQVTGREAGSYSYNSSDLQMVVTSSALFILGPTAVWIHFASRLVYFASIWPRPRPRTRQQTLNWWRNLLFNLWTGNIGMLTALVIYSALGGRLPLPGLALRDVGPAFVAILFDFVFSGAVLWAFVRQQMAFLPQTDRSGLESRGVSLMRFFAVGGLPAFFAILGAALYSQMGLGAFLFFMLAVLLASLLARRLSQAAVMNQRQSRQLAQLEELGRAIIATPADSLNLSQLLADFLPHMFDYERAEIRFFTGETLLSLPQSAAPLDSAMWEWLETTLEPLALSAGEPLPWEPRRPALNNLLLAPIFSNESNEPLGGICLMSRSHAAAVGLPASLPSLQVLAAQIASTLHRSEVYAQRLAYERVQQELAFARQIQVSFLPEELPRLPGWQLSATLIPARTTSGDFYDVIALPDGRVGLIVADVADKGMGAALFMALSRTLLRTQAYAYPRRPDRVLAAANERILADTNSELFVTVFYGVLQPESGEFVYANAGHSPALLLGAGSHEALSNTGMPLGVWPESAWEARRVQVARGQLLVLYTDGITEAHSANDQLFGEERLLHAVQRCEGQPVQLVQDEILGAVMQFSAAQAQLDDVTVMLLQREYGGDARRLLEAS
ncbi:MAG TPA: PP2C family protein-serine/threonine phosphatase [Candidatus Sulfomarinibacteraceae bacterium]|nr:PP2C family protein-serine/threonine phosphatase [Candidatus Sulfomarinibacteraceae bacterium]